MKERASVLEQGSVRGSDEAIELSAASHVIAYPSIELYRDCAGNAAIAPAADADVVFNNAVCFGVAPVQPATDVRQDGVAAARRLAVGVVGRHGDVPGVLVRRLSLCASDCNAAADQVGGIASPGLPRAKIGRAS